jgi:hypothetical protein
MSSTRQGITVKCVLNPLLLKKGGKVEPGLVFTFPRACGKASVYKDISKKRAIELLELRTKEDCERVNRELGN